MTDQELLFLLEHDPEAGIHELMQMYGGAIYTICKNFLADCPESDIEETVADTYIHFWKYRNRFVPDENHSVKSYLYAIARNAARDRRRALNKHSVFSLEEISLDLPSVHNVESAYEKQRDEEILHEVGKKYKTIVTAEDGMVAGGLGSAVLEWMADHGYTPRVIRLGVNDQFVEHGSTKELYHLLKLDKEGLCESLLQVPVK